MKSCLLHLVSLNPSPGSQLKCHPLQENVPYHRPFSTLDCAKCLLCSHVRPERNIAYNPTRKVCLKLQLSLLHPTWGWYQGILCWS